MRPEKNARIVLDTNVVISALISKKGPPTVLLEAFEKEKLTLLLSDSVLAEYLRVLGYPKIRKYLGVTDDFIAHVAALFIRFAERVEVTSSLELSPDSDDNKFLELAADGKATLIVSGDKADLLALKTVEAIPIVTASEAVERLELKC